MAEKESGTLFPDGVPEGYVGCEGCGSFWPEGGVEHHRSGCRYGNPEPVHEHIPLDQTMGGLRGPAAEHVYYDERGVGHGGGSETRSRLDQRREEICRRFTYHPPRPDQQPKYVQLRAEAYTFAMIIVELAPDCREASLALTKLEEAVMHANSAIARRS